MQKITPGILTVVAALLAVFSCAQVQAAEATPKPKAVQKAPPPQPPQDVELQRDVQYGSAGGAPLYMHIAKPKATQDKPLPAIVFIHGGGWHEGDRDSNLHGAFRFVQAGYVAVTVEYRLAQEAPFPAQIQDCKCAIRFLRANAAKYGIDPDHIGVIGDSAGGHLVAMLAVTDGVEEFEGDGGWKGVSSRVQAACDWFGPSDLLAWVKDEKVGERYAKDKFLAILLGGAPLEKPERALWASPISYVEKSKYIAPILIVHGTKDPNVPLSQSLLLADAIDAKGGDVTFRIVLNEGHGGGGFFGKIWPDMSAFFEKHLKPDAAKAAH